MSLMYEYNGKRIKTWNPYPYHCEFNCTYCWVKNWLKQFPPKCELCRTRSAHFHKERMNQKFKPGEVWFVESTADPYFIPEDILKQIFEHLAKFPETKFLIQSKNPVCFQSYMISNSTTIPENIFLGTTIETTYDNLAEVYSKAPRPTYRFQIMWILKANGKKELYLTLEPLMVTDLSTLLSWVMDLDTGKLEIFVGMDNHRNFLPEPPLEFQELLVKKLEELLGKERVHKKQIRKAWYE